MLNFILFPFFWLGARLIRFGLCMFGFKKVVAVQISNYRDEADVRLFGFWNIEKAPRVLSWTQYAWEGIRGKLFMIRVTTDQIKKALENAASSPRELLRIRELFMEAVDEAIKLGVKNVLLAAATKRLFKKGELELLFPGVIFTLGDNFTGLLLARRIKDNFRIYGLNPKTSRVLVIAPYGFLGKVALCTVCELGCQVVGFGNSKRPELTNGLAKKFGFFPVFDFSDVGKVDMVIACSEARPVQLTPERVKMIRKAGKKLIVIDPCEPANMTPEMVKKCLGAVTRFDAGNGYSSRLKYVLGYVSYRVLRLTKGETWGCFCENFLIAKHENLQQEEDWFSVTPERIERLKKYYGNGMGQFCLPPASCHGKSITTFPLYFSEGKIKNKGAFNLVWDGIKSIFL